MAQRMTILLPNPGNSIGITVHSPSETGEWLQTQVHHLRPGQCREFDLHEYQRVVIFELQPQAPPVEAQE